MARSPYTLRLLFLGSMRLWMRRDPHALSFKVVCTVVAARVFF
jgi:hypothetical protein